VPWVKKELRLEGDEVDGGERRPAAPGAEADEVDGALQSERGAIVQMPKPDINKPGLGAAANPFKLVPPDTNGDVGGGYYVQMVNVAFGIYDAADGSKEGGPFFMSAFFSPNNQKLCATHNDGDPIVVYDEYAGVWVISQFGLNFNKPRFAECIAVSETSDPMGAWNGYQFDYPNSNVFNDYPKLGVWPAANNSAYFASFNQFRCSASVCDFDWRGGGAVAYERDAMIAGDPADQIYVNLYPVDPNMAGQLPADADGAIAPGANEPNVFAQFDASEWGYSPDQLRLFEFEVDWSDDSGSFNGPTILPTAKFNPAICGYQFGFPKYDCVPQKGTKNKLDSLNDRMMHRLQWREIDGDEYLVVNQTVKSGKKQAGLRWYQLMDDGSGWSIANQSTYSPDAKKSRWMGSVAMDADGNIAAGYSISSKGIYPSIAIAGHTATGPPDTLDLAERKVFTGKGSEHGKYGRWGDYSAMTVAEDGCTFYYTTQYYKKTGQWKWATRIVKFQIDSGACIT
jgi:hypothetical protein